MNARVLVRLEILFGDDPLQFGLPPRADEGSPLGVDLARDTSSRSGPLPLLTGLRELSDEHLRL